MKKSLLLLAVSFLFTFSTFSQVKISGGILGGLNLANASVDPTPTGVSIDNYTCFGFGGVLNFAFEGGFGIQVEPMYLQKGAKISYTGGADKLKASYIEIPAMITYTFSTGEGQVEPYVLAGPTFGILMTAKYVDNAGNETDQKDLTSSTDFGAIFGAGVRIPAGMNKVFIEGRYSLGFTNINKDPTMSGTTIKTKGIQFFAGITFPFGS